MQNRKITVNRLRLITQLKENLTQHRVVFAQAMAGYITKATEKLAQEQVLAVKLVEARFLAAKRQLDEFDPLLADQTPDNWKIMDAVIIALPVPRDYSEAYEAAIDAAIWETGETMVLSYAEFQCFVRDIWDWKSAFEAVTFQYMARRN